MAAVRTSLSILLFFIATALSAQELVPLADVAAFHGKIKKASASTQSIKADFTEERVASYLKEPQRSSGTFYYKKNNKLRWEKKQPSSYILLVDGDKVKLKENGQEKNISAANAMIGRIRDLMLSLVNGDFSSNKAFIPQYYENASSYVVKLVPKSKRLASVFDHIRLTLSKETMRPKEIVFQEKSGDKNTMKFFNDSVNQELNDRLFTQF